MADLTIVAKDVGILNPEKAILHRLPAAIASIVAGDLVRLDTSTGKVTWADGSNAAGSKVLGIAVDSPRFANDVITICERGQVGLGPALDSEPLDAPVYLSDTDSAGHMTTTQGEGTTATVVGRVFPLWQGETVKKILDVDCSINRLGIVAQAAAEAGTSTVPYLWTPERVKQAIAALESP